jgi:uncharacterized protein (TIGR03435 family)
LNRAAVQAVFLAAGSVAWAQAQPPYKFDVATVKPNSTDDHRIMMRFGGRTSATGVNLKLLMTVAYDVRDFQIVGGPGWLATDRFDIVAKAEGVPDQLTPEQFRPMLVALIEDRFQLKIHRETKEMPVYALVVAKNGTKLKANAGEPGPRLRMGRGQLNGTKVPLKMLVQQLAQQLGRPVVDKTGLTGDYDFTLTWTPQPGEGGAMFAGPGGPGGPEGPPPSDPDGPSIFAAIQEQLGLKLESDKGPVEILVLDQVEKPTEN